MKRCVVSSPSALYKDGEGLVSPPGLGIVDLNYYTLYWDQLVIPTHSSFIVALPNEEEYIDLGILDRPVVGDGNFDSSTFLIEYDEEKKKLLKRMQCLYPDQDWYMHGIGDMESEQNVSSSKETTFRATIFNALPVPSFEIPLVEILEFKERNKDDLNGLHNHLDEIYSHIITSPDIPLLRTKSFERFNNSLKDINRLSEIAWEAPFWQRYSLGFTMPTLSETIGGLMSVGTALASGDKVSLGVEITKSLSALVRLENTHKKFTYDIGLKKDLSFLACGYRENIFR